MAAHGMFTVTELVPLLHDRGIDLSASQVHRLASGTPERLSLAVLAALCDILSCTPAELIATRAQDATAAQGRHRRRGGQPERPRTSPKRARLKARGMSTARAAKPALRPLRARHRNQLGTLARGLPLLDVPHARAGNLRAVRRVRRRPAHSRHHARRRAALHRLQPSMGLGDFACGFCGRRGILLPPRHSCGNWRPGRAAGPPARRRDRPHPARACTVRRGVLRDEAPQGRDDLDR